MAHGKAAKRAAQNEGTRSPPASTYKKRKFRQREKKEQKEQEEEAARLSNATGAEDDDAIDEEVAAACGPYASDLTAFQRESEKARMPSPSYMTRQADISSRMRAVVIDWLVDVSRKYELCSQTLHIAIHLFDRHLESNLSLPRGQLQLVGITALYVAVKYEEVRPPATMEEFVKLTDGAYSFVEMREMEGVILTSVDNRVTFPTAYGYIQRFILASGTRDDRVEHFAHYVVDSSLQNFWCLKYEPSRIAAAAVFVARTQMNDLPAWNSTIERLSSYSVSAIQECVDALTEMIARPHDGPAKWRKLTAVRRKFEKEKFLGVATYPIVSSNS